MRLAWRTARRMRSAAQDATRRVAPDKPRAAMRPTSQMFRRFQLEEKHMQMLSLQDESVKFTLQCLKDMREQFESDAAEQQHADSAAEMAGQVCIVPCACVQAGAPCPLCAFACVCAVSSDPFFALAGSLPRATQYTVVTSAALDGRSDAPYLAHMRRTYSDASPHVVHHARVSARGRWGSSRCRRSIPPSANK